MKLKRDNDHNTLQSCQCGWVGSSNQLGVWVRRDHIVARICPQCGNPNVRPNKPLFRGQQSRLVH